LFPSGGSRLEAYYDIGLSPVLLRVKARKAVVPPSACVEALRLLGAWNRIARGHVALAAGCSCGVGVASLQVQDFEEEILQFLRGRHAARAQSIPELLAGVARSGGEEARPLLADLARTIDSFEEQHSGR
jgi:hypothetical protein